MRKLTIASLLVLGASMAFASGPIYWDNGTFTTGVGDGFGGANTSKITPDPGGSLFGFGAQIGAGNSMADDFTVGTGGAVINGIRVYMYQTGGNITTSTFTGLKYNIGGAPYVFGAADPTVATVDTFSGVYRVTGTTLLNAQRPIWCLSYKFNPITLAAGTYWLSWQASGSLASGPWQPPTASIAPGNAVQYTAGTGAYNPAIDTGSGLQKELAFAIQGVAVPEPGTFLAIAAGIGILAAARRRRK